MGTSFDRREWLGFAVTAGIVLALIALAWNLARAESAPIGWHDGHAGGMQVWPATNSPAWLMPNGTSIVQVVNGRTNTAYAATNLYRGYGLFICYTNQIFTNWFLVESNYFTVTGTTTNFLGTPRYTNAGLYATPVVPSNGGAILVTNSLGISIGRPTNNNSICITNLLERNASAPDYCLLHRNATFGRPFATNTWIRDVVATEDSDEYYRWSLLRGLDTTNIVAGVTNVTYWFNRNLPLSQGYAGFPLYLPHVLAGGTTNAFSTDSSLTNLYIWPPGTTNGPWPFPYAPGTNLFINVTELQMLDIFLGLHERQHINPGGGQFNWHFGQGFVIPGPNGQLMAGLLAGEDFKGVDGNSAKARVRDIASRFAVQSLADASGKFTNAIPMWGDSGNVETELVARLSLPGTNLTFIVGGRNYTGWSGSYFRFTPINRLTTNYPGKGHVFIGTWYNPPRWTTSVNTNAMTTNQWPLPCTTGFRVVLQTHDPGEICEGPEDDFGVDGLLMTQSVFSVLHSVSNCVVNGSTNVCLVNLKVYLRGQTWTNNFKPESEDEFNCYTQQTIFVNNSDTLLLNTNLSNPIASLTVSNIVLTNYDVAPGWHEIDYGPDGVKKCIDAFAWPVFSLTGYSSNWVQTGRWALSNTVNTANVGTWAATNAGGTIFLSNRTANAFPSLLKATNTATLTSSALLYPETYTNLTATRELYVHTTLPGNQPTITKWDDFGSGLLSGVWQRISVQSNSAGSDVSFSNFVYSTAPTAGTTNFSGWAIDGAKVILKYDFLFHP